MWLASCTTEAPVEPPPARIELTDEDNYGFDGTLDIPMTPVAATTDLTIDWSGLVSDLQCHDVDPVADIDNIAVLAFPLLGEGEVEAGLQASNLEQVDLGGYVSLEVGDRTSVQLSELGFLGNDVDIETLTTEGSATWLALLQTGITVGVGTRALGFFQPGTDPNTSLDLSPNCGILDFTAGFAATVPVRAQGPYTLAWTEVTLDALGNPFDAGVIDTVMLGWYPEHSAQELAAAFLDLELLAAEIWIGVPEGGAIDLATIEGFGGFEGEGTWLFALRCSTCSNPAPPFAAILEPR